MSSSELLCRARARRRSRGGFRRGAPQAIGVLWIERRFECRKNFLNFEAVAPRVLCDSEIVEVRVLRPTTGPDIALPRAILAERLSDPAISADNRRFLEIRRDELDAVRRSWGSP